MDVDNQYNFDVGVFLDNAYDKYCSSISIYVFSLFSALIE